MDALGDALVHLVRNALDHGVETREERVRAGKLALRLVEAERAGAQSDDAILALVFAPGFSTSAVLSDVSSRGVGMDAVRHAITALGGHVALSSKPGDGTTVRLTFPRAGYAWDGAEDTDATNPEFSMGGAQEKVRCGA